MRINKFGSYLFLIAFALFLWGFSLLDVLTPPRAYSEMENRELREAPRMTARSLLHNQWTLDYEAYTSDQFLQRDGWITVKSVAESALGKTENNGVVYGKNGYLFEKALTADTQQLEKNIGYVSEFAGKYPGYSVTLTIVPNSYAILPNLLPENLHNVDQLSLIRELYGKAEAAGVKVLDAAPVLTERAGDKYNPNSFPGTVGEYLYYRTDHHWTTRGAYLVYAEYIRRLGREPVGFEALTGHEVPGFYGTYYSKAKLFSAVPDTITWYDIPAEVSVDVESRDGVCDTPKFQTRDKYAAFLHGNNAVTVLRRPQAEREAGEEPSRILLIKDSYGNCFAPFLLYSFDEVTVLDLRYFNDVEAYLTQNRFDEIYILYNFSAFAQETTISNLRR